MKNATTVLDEAMAAAEQAERDLDAAQVMDDPEAIALAKAAHLAAQAAVDAVWEAVRAEEQAA